MRSIFINLAIFILCIGFSCKKAQTVNYFGGQLEIFPDYSNVVIPPNIAPFNFDIIGESGKYKVRFIARNDSFEISCNNKVNIPAEKWEKILTGNTGKELKIRIFADKGKYLEQYGDLSLFIAAEPVDGDDAV